MKGGEKEKPTPNIFHSCKSVAKGSFKLKKVFGRWKGGSLAFHVLTYLRPQSKSGHCSCCYDWLLLLFLNICTVLAMHMVLYRVT